MYACCTPAVRLQIPLVYSNPELWPAPVITSALVSHLDFVPTMASLLGLPSTITYPVGWTGVDYSTVVLNSTQVAAALAAGDPAADASLITSVQDYILFTFDDFEGGGGTGPYGEDEGGGTSFLVKNHPLRPSSKHLTS